MHHPGRQPRRRNPQSRPPHIQGGLRYHDTSAASVLFAVYTSEPQKPGHPKPHAATIAALTCALAERGMTIRDGLFVGDNTVSPYDCDPQDALTLPLKATQSSQINAEFIYRGSTIAPTNHITLPPSTKENRTADAVDDRVKAIHTMNRAKPSNKPEHSGKPC